jgi:hypothetical protein
MIVESSLQATVRMVMAAVMGWVVMVAVMG